MRNIININQSWSFSKEATAVPEALCTDWEAVTVPHCWNAVDGQGGADEYYRGRCVYERTIPHFDGRVYLEFCGANTVCELFVNGVYIGSHENGYSMFRFEITDFLYIKVHRFKIIIFFFLFISIIFSFI